MERDLFRALQRSLRVLGRRRSDRRQRYTDGRIVEVYCWAAVNDRPVLWATSPCNWPSGLRRGPLPTQSCMSRRLRSASVKRLMARLERYWLRRSEPNPLVAIIDAKPLMIGPHSQDPHARWGRGASMRCKGYKLHVLTGLDLRVLEWRLTPMNTDEREMARRMLLRTGLEGYVLGDGNFDSSALFDAAGRTNGQLVAPRRWGTKRGLGHMYQSPWRLRCKDLLENTVSPFGRELFAHRRAIERLFGHLASSSGLLTHLPSWVRTYRRVYQWVQVKLIYREIRRSVRQTRAKAA